MNRSAWKFVAYQGPLNEIENFRSFLKNCLDNGIYNSHQIQMITPPLEEPPAQKILMIDGHASFGLGIRKDFLFEVPESFIIVDEVYAAAIFGIGGIGIIENGENEEE